MVSTVILMILSIIKSIVIAFVLHSICGKKMENRFPVIGYILLISMCFISVKDFWIMSFLVSFFTLMYCRTFLQGSVLVHEMIMAIVYVIIFLSRLLPLLLTRMAMGKTLTENVMVGSIGVSVFFSQFNLCILLFWCVWYITKKQYREWKMELYYVICVEIFRIALYTHANKNAGAMVEVDLFTQSMIASLEVFFVITYGMIFYMQRTNATKIQNIKLRNKCEQEQEKVMMMQQDYFEARKIRHNIISTNNMYYSMLKNGDVCEVMRLLKSDKTGAEQLLSFSKHNKMINAILNDFSTKCKNYEMDFKITMDDLCLGKIEKDVSLILMNLLDNAFEASDISTGKTIKLRIFLHNKMYNIICKNSIDNSVLDRNPKLKTNKDDSKVHGIGIQIIRSKTDEYGGLVDFGEENGFFIAHIMIPFQEAI
ncbi:MAG: GHKL domain-containing protein [Lachnospiraceae bacterium]